MFSQTETSISYYLKLNRRCKTRFWQKVVCCSSCSVCSITENLIFRHIDGLTLIESRIFKSLFWKSLTIKKCPHQSGSTSIRGILVTTSKQPQLSHIQVLTIHQNHTGTFSATCWVLCFALVLAFILWESFVNGQRTQPIYTATTRWWVETPQ